MLNENEINADAGAIRLDASQARPAHRASDLTVAKQQMVEIAKALSFNSQVLIMDEPTAALTESEIEELFRIIHELQARGRRDHISHRLEELKQISDNVTVMRDGRYVDTVPAARMPISRIISMMVGRTIYESAPEVPADVGQPAVLEVKNLNHAGVLLTSTRVREGEILGFAGLMGAGRTRWRAPSLAPIPSIPARFT